MAAEQRTSGGDVRAEAASSYLLQISRRAMACQFQVFLNAGQNEGAAEVALAALDLVEELESQLTVYCDDSEVSLLNANAATRAVRVESQLFELLQQSVRISEQTGGAFDITSGPLSKLWGFHRRDGRIPAQHDIDETLKQVGSDCLLLQPESSSVGFRKQGVEINLGSIGKGFALDRCAELLSAAGIENFMLHGGHSSVLARGSRQRGDESGWSVAVRHPLRSEQTLATMRLQNRSLATSGSGNQFFHHQGRRFGHILDPRSGWPVEGVLSATVVAPDATHADALATAFFVLGKERAFDYCREHPEYAALFVCPGERTGATVVESINFKEDELEIAAPG